MTALARTSVEFYVGFDGPCLVRAETHAVPREGEYVNISRKTYRVLRVTWAVDQPTGLPPQMRANVDLEIAE